MAPNKLLATLCFGAIAVSVPADAQPARAAAEAEAVTEPEIEVVGARSERPSVRPTGSRIARREAIVDYQTVATTTGVAGLTPGSGMDPFAGGTRTVTAIECRSDDPRLSEDAACRLAPIQRLIDSGSYEEAASALDRFAAAPGISDGERYIAARLQYGIAASSGDPLGREDALQAMLATAAMPAAERLQALRTLVALALRSGGDRDTAAARMEQLLHLAPDDTRTLVNLASLRADAGRHSEATALVRRAIAAAQARGEPVPAEWSSFASSQAPDR